MKILLINNNPVVSRLTALSARKEEIEIDEIQEVTELTSNNYDIVFVDADSWNEDVKSTIFTDIKSQKRVLFYAQDDTKDLDTFDKVILKPFLPSEVSAVIRSVEEIVTLDDISNEIEKEKGTVSKDDMLENVVASTLSESETINLESAEVKTDLIDALEKVEEEKVEEEKVEEEKVEEEKVEEEKVEETLMGSAELEDDLFKKTSEELFELDLNDSKVPLDNELFSVEEKTTDKELDDGLFEFDLEKDNEVDFDLEKDNEVALDLEKDNEVETKVLNEEEIETIKEILDDDVSEETMQLDDLVVPAMAGVAAMALTSDKSETEEFDEFTDKKKKKKSKKEKKVVTEETESSDALVDTLASLKVESLKELLAGATVTLNIQFPKE